MNRFGEIALDLAICLSIGGNLASLLTSSLRSGVSSYGDIAFILALVLIHYFCLRSCFVSAVRLINKSNQERPRGFDPLIKPNAQDGV